MLNGVAEEFFGDQDQSLDVIVRQNRAGRFHKIADRPELGAPGAEAPHFGDIHLIAP